MKQSKELLNLVKEGYALKAFVPFSRYTRDCDFALRKINGWALDLIKNWLSKNTNVESFEKRDD